MEQYLSQPSWMALDIAGNLAADPLGFAEELTNFHRLAEEGHHAHMRMFLQNAYALGRVFLGRMDQFDRLKESSFWRASRQKPKYDNVMKWTVIYVMRATSNRMRSRAGRYAKVLNCFLQSGVLPEEVADLIESLDGVEEILRRLGPTRRRLDERDEHLREGDRRDDLGKNRAIDVRAKCIRVLKSIESSQDAARLSESKWSLRRRVAIGEGLFVTMPKLLLREFLAFSKQTRERGHGVLFFTIEPRGDGGPILLTGDSVNFDPPQQVAADALDRAQVAVMSGPPIVDVATGDGAEAQPLAKAVELTVKAGTGAPGLVTREPAPCSFEAPVSQGSAEQPGAGGTVAISRASSSAVERKKPERNVGLARSGQLRAAKAPVLVKQRFSRGSFIKRFPPR